MLYERKGPSIQRDALSFKSCELLEIRKSMYLVRELRLVRLPLVLLRVISNTVGCKGKRQLLCP